MGKTLLGVTAPNGARPVIERLPSPSSKLHAA